MLYLLLILLIIVNLIWLALAFFNLPGNWLIVFSTTLFAWWRWDDRVFSIYTLAAIIIIAALAECLEFLAAAAGTKKAGGSFRAALAALFGGITGAIVGTVTIPIPFLGTLLGAAAGAFAGSWTMELSKGKSLNRSAHVGLHAGLSQIKGILSKTALGLLIWIIVTIAAFYP